MGFNINDVNNTTELSLEEGYNLVRYYVHYYWVTNKYYSLKNAYEEEDVVNEVYCKLLRHNHFEKYDSTKTTKKYHISLAVSRTMIDMLRKYHECSSLDKESPENGLTFGDLVVDNTQNVDLMASGKADRDAIIAQLPTTCRSKVRGYSEYFGREVGLDYRTLALLLEANYTTKEIASIYKNPKTGESVSEGSISRHIQGLREYMLNEVRFA